MGLYTSSWYEWKRSHFWFLDTGKHFIWYLFVQTMGTIKYIIRIKFWKLSYKWFYFNWGQDINLNFIRLRILVSRTKSHIFGILVLLIFPERFCIYEEINVIYWFFLLPFIDLSNNILILMYFFLLLYYSILR